MMGINVVICLDCTSCIALIISDRSVKRYKAAPGYDELFLMDPITDVIYPGAIIKGEIIPTGEYIPIIADRKPVTISVSLQEIAGSPSTVDEPKLSTVREALNNILRGSGGSAVQSVNGIEGIVDFITSGGGLFQRFPRGCSLI